MLNGRYGSTAASQEFSSPVAGFGHKQPLNAQKQTGKAEPIDVRISGSD